MKEEKIMVSKEFIEGLIIGSLRKNISNIKKNIDGKFFDWSEFNDTYEIGITYTCGHYLEDLNKMEEILKNFCKVEHIIISCNGYIMITLNKEDISK